ncbi:class I SAM-dependent methyltransferase [Polaromonas sp.]|uniref:class I SAM-dependent methyltransferase n=1 Tax=Polaromonas sp. TaxID=1869339 RepID=UPI00356589C9
MGKAYGRYYTHDAAAEKGLLSVIKQRVRNEYWSHTLQTTIGPRLGTPSWAAVFFKRLKPWIAEPFGLRQLAQMPKGYLIDVGCGNGNTLKTAQQLGWRTLGIELDAHAVKAARAQGLLVIQGGYDELRSLAGQADCLMCSHVLEHVQEPLEMLRLLLAALKPRGVLLLSTPNASSYLRDFYGENWRGLEAPRHLAIADAAWLMNWLCAQGFQCTQVPCWDGVSAIESERIRRRDLTTRPTDVKAGKRAVRLYGKPSLHKHDTVQIVCTRA